MKKNVSNTDRIIRLIVAVIFASLYLTNSVNGTLGIILMVAAVIFAFTALISFCPIYAILGIKTTKTETKPGE